MKPNTEQGSDRDAFEREDFARYELEMPEYVFNRGYQAATAYAEAKYLPVIEKLVEALTAMRLKFYYDNDSTAELTASREALALAAPLLGRK